MFCTFSGIKTPHSSFLSGSEVSNKRFFIFFKPLALIVITMRRGVGVAAVSQQKKSKEKLEVKSREMKGSAVEEVYFFNSVLNYYCIGGIN